jgi:phosphoenolpyruvate synthase/pyruvate phosphate dikinase
MMPLSEAQKQGLVKASEVDRLRPGSNREVKYYEWSEAEKRYDTVGQHKVVVDLERSTDVVELYNTSSPIMGKGEKCMSFSEIGELGTAARALFGEKSLVLSLMTGAPGLKEFVPPGSAISTLRVQRMLDDAGVLGKWVDLWEKDPDVGKITDANFLESRFYTDAAYRKTAREEMGATVRKSLGELLLDAEGKPTAKGKELLDELRANPDLAACGNWIVRSSFTAEDRPGKSGAGQYDSFPNCRNDKDILEGVVGVVASAWEAPPVENNVREEYNLSRIWPAITVMKCIEPEYSGVMVSRDTGTGHRRTASYQAVMGFGGGVEDGVTEQGKIREGGKNELANLIKGQDKPLVGDDMAQRLWTIANECERLFHKVVEPGRGMAVDMEWCVEKGQFYLVQARTIRA